MQAAKSLRRVAREAVEDLAADGVVLAELRFAPLLHLSQGLSPQDAIDAVSAGIRDGVEASNESLVVGVGLAEPGAGYLPSGHPALGQLARKCRCLTTWCSPPRPQCAGPAVPGDAA